MFTSAPSIHLTTPPRHTAHPVFQQARVALGTAFSWLSTLPHDSRDSLPLTELASFGVTWTADLGHETILAQELATSRLRRTHGPERQQDR
jgi:hypothetical protein